MWSETNHKVDVLVWESLGRESSGGQCQTQPVTGPGLLVRNSKVIHKC